MKHYNEIAENVLRRRDEFDAKKKRRQQAMHRAGTVLTAIAMIICVLGTIGTCYVVAVYAGAGEWFKSYFRNQDDPTLTTEQQEFIDDSAAKEIQSVTCNDVTITVKSAITDGRVAYVLLDIVAPNDMVLDDFNLSSDPILGNGTSYIDIDDGDGLANTASMVLRLYTSSPRFSNFSYFGKNSLNLLLKNLYRRQETSPFTKITLVRGEWRFLIDFDCPNNVEYLDILKEPITVYGANLYGDPYPFILTSFRLRGLSAECLYTFPEGTTQQASDFGDFQIVMQDGTIVNAHPKSATAQTSGSTEENPLGDCFYLFDAPVVFDEIDYILLSDGRQIEVNP